MDYHLFERKFLAPLIVYVVGPFVLVFVFWAASKIRRVFIGFMEPHSQVRSGGENNANEIKQAPTVLKQPDYPRLKGPEET